MKTTNETLQSILSNPPEVHAAVLAKASDAELESLFQSLDEAREDCTIDQDKGGALRLAVLVEQGRRLDERAEG